ncbi:MAG: DNA polymerase III subunit beta [Candidatus Babeliales bacterium]
MSSYTFEVEQKELMPVLSLMQPICTKRTTLEVTTYLLLQIGHRELVVKGTDLEISLQASCSLEKSSAQEQVSFLVPGKRLYDLLKELEGTLTFTFDNNLLTIQSGSIDLSLHVKSADDFPQFPERIENLMDIESSFLFFLLSKVIFLIPQNNANPSLNGLLLEIEPTYLRMTTTDGHCLAQVTTSRYKLETSKKWLLPRRAVFEIKKLLEGNQQSTIFLGVCGNQLVFSGESFNFFTKLLVNSFPDYQSILNKNGYKPATVNRQTFTKMLRRSACLLSHKFIATKFTFFPGILDVSMENNDIGSLAEQLPIESSLKKDVTMRFYSPYLLSGLQIFSDEEVRFSIYDAQKPIVFDSESDECTFLYLVMPVSPQSVS